MEILYERCAGFDTHKKTVQVCCITPDEGQRRRKDYRNVASKTAAILQ